MMPRCWVASALLALVALVTACPHDPNPAAPDAGVADAGVVDAETAADAQPSWDPVWHETKPKVWPTLGPEKNPSCGPACRVALNQPIEHGVYYAHGFTTTSVIDNDSVSIFRAAVGSDRTEVLADLNRAVGFSQTYAERNLVSYRRRNRANETRFVEVMNVLTGETKQVYQAIGEGDIALTALNSTHVFWIREGFGLMSRNMKTGEIRIVAPGPHDCAPLCAVEGGLVCALTTRTVFIDQETGIRKPLDDGGALQTEGTCSADHTKVVWIDFRDPPGNKSSYDYRTGGEVYVRDLVKKETKRLTFDSPGAPVAKVFPAIGGDIVSWLEQRGDLPPNPEARENIYAGSEALVRLDLRTGQRCRSEVGAGVGSFASVHEGHLYGYRTDKPSSKSYLVDIDLMSPLLEWKCR